MLSRKRIFTSEEKEHLHRVYSHSTITELCTIFHVERDRMREILIEENLTGRMHRGYRKVEPVGDVKCSTCKSFSGRKGTVDGWCLKRKMRVRKRDFCSEHVHEEKTCYVI